MGSVLLPTRGKLSHYSESHKPLYYLKTALPRDGFSRESKSKWVAIYRRYMRNKA
jgi:hypothetical protein